MDTTKNCRLQSWTLYKSADCRWISVTILYVSFTNSLSDSRETWTSPTLQSADWPISRQYYRPQVRQRVSNILKYNVGFRLTCRLPHCRFDDDICTTAQASLAAEGWPSGKQRQANRSITLPLCPPRQIADSWILFNSGAMPLGDKAKAALPLTAATLKQQAMITRHSGKAASGKLVWNQHKYIQNPWYYVVETVIAVYGNTKVPNSAP